MTESNLIYDRFVFICARKIRPNLWAKSNIAAKFENLVASAARLYRLASVGAKRAVCGLVNLKLKVSKCEKRLVGGQFGASFSDAAL